MNAVIVRLFMLVLILILASISVHVSRVAVLLEDLTQSNRELINAQFSLGGRTARLSADMATLQELVAQIGGKAVKDRLTKKGGTQ
jgi:hypothetical protein